jgi:sugar lactone lactonase YvrE
MQGRRLWWLAGIVLCLLGWVAGCPGPITDVVPDGGRSEPPLAEAPDAGLTPELPDGGQPPAGEDAGVDAGEVEDGGGEQPPPPPPPPAHDPDAIRKENQREGSRDWRITRQVANNREIEGYALVTTVAPGESLPVAVSVSAEPHTFQWFVYRLGYYGGKGAREVARGGPVRGVKQAECPADRATGVVACSWAPSFEVEVKGDWVRGAYLVKLRRNDGYQRFVPFFVRDVNPRSEVAVMIPTATWAAYNTWGGTSLYDDKLGVMRQQHGVSRAFQASYDRPYYRNLGTGHLLSDDYSLIQWLESQGLDVAYLTNEDMDATGDFLREAKVLFMSGHDEYWSRAIRDRVEQAVGRGVSLLNLGANQAYWQVRLEAAKDGRPRRTVTCYKAHAADPVGLNSPERTVKFRDAPVRRPENALLGVQFSSRWHQFAFPTVITHPDHWAFAGTGLRAGDTLWMANGYEQDQLVGNGATPPGVEVLAESPALSLQGAFGFGHMVVRQQGSALIFSAGGVDFVRTLSSEQTADPRAARLVANVLYRVLGRPVPSDLVEFRPKERPVTKGPFAREVRTVAGVPGLRGTVDGRVGPGQLGAPVAVAVLPDLVGGGWVVADALANAVKRIHLDGRIETLSTDRLNGPMGIAADDAGNVYVSDTDNACIRRIAPDGTATVFAGAVGQAGSADGAAAQARFNQPAGLTLTPDRSGLLVADLGNGVIRQVSLVEPGNPVTTLKANLWLYRPSAVAAAPDGTLYIVETGMSRVVQLRDGTVSVVAGQAPGGYTDGAPEAAQMLPYLGIAVLADGSVVVADPGNYRLRRITFGQDGKPNEVTTLAGSGRYGADDGAGQGATFVLPAGLALGADGTLYVADSGNALLRAVTP